TTGNQMTASRTARLEAVAAACGYARVARCDDVVSLRALMNDLSKTDGPTCLLIKVNRWEADNNIPRITSRYTPEETAFRVRSAITQHGMHARRAIKRFELQI